MPDSTLYLGSPCADAGTERRHRRCTLRRGLTGSLLSSLELTLAAQPQTVFTQPPSTFFGTGSPFAIKAARPNPLLTMLCSPLPKSRESASKPMAVSTQPHRCASFHLQGWIEPGAPPQEGNSVSSPPHPDIQISSRHCPDRGLWLRAGSLSSFQQK